MKKNGFDKITKKEKSIKKKSKSPTMSKNAENN